VLTKNSDTKSADTKRAFVIYHVSEGIFTPTDNMEELRNKFPDGLLNGIYCWLELESAQKYKEIREEYGGRVLLYKIKVTEEPEDIMGSDPIEAMYNSTEESSIVRKMEEAVYDLRGREIWVIRNTDIIKDWSVIE